MVELLHRSVFNELIRYTDAPDFGIISVIGHKFEYGASHTSFNDSIFYRYDMAELFADFVQ